MKFFDLFPVPKILILTDAGVSITDRAVRFISLLPRFGGESKVGKFGELPIPEGVISNGVVNDKNMLAKTLSNLREKYGLKFVSATLPEEQSYLFKTTVDKVPYRDLNDAIAFKIDDSVPVPLKNSLFAFEIIELGVEVKAAVSVLPTKTVETYTEAFELAGLTPVSFDVESQALARAVIPKGDNRSHLIINLEEKKAGLFLAENEVVQFSSTIPLDIQNLQNEIKRLFVFWGKKIERVVVCGRLASDDSLVSRLMGEIETPYTLGNVWTRVASVERYLPEMPFDESLGYGSAIGAALHESTHAYV